MDNKKTMKLSILIASLPQRTKTLTELLDILNPQITDECEIVINIDKAKKIGEKRNDLVASAKGDFVIFIDDDDLVSSDYVSLIIGAMDLNPDFISIEGWFYPQEQGVKVPFSQRFNSVWGVVDDVLIRGVTHISAVKRALAIKCPFPETNYGEDREFEKEFVKVALQGQHIQKKIYTHRFSENKEYKK